MPKRRRNNEIGVVYQLTNREITDLVKAFDVVRLASLSPTQIKKVRAWEQFFMAGLTDPVGRTIEEEI